jgi:aldose 1-epimerase
VTGVTSPSGEQWTIRRGGQEATIVEVGGGLRTYRVDGAEVVAGYADDEVCRAGRGQLLAPWPNRVRDGKYVFEGSSHQLALTDPPRHNASHGLVRWSSWRWDSGAEDGSAATLRTRLFPQPGWDGTLDLSVGYALGDDGLTVTTTATNVGAVHVPFGLGAHPYIALGDTPLADVELTVPADAVVVDQLVPTSTETVAGDTDFRHARRLGATSLDTAYTGLARGDHGRWEVVVGGLEGLGGAVTVWGDGAFEWVQVFTAQGADTGVAGTRGIAVEPMSCPADAFNSGDGLVVLEPGQSWTGTWGIVPDVLS